MSRACCRPLLGNPCSQCTKFPSGQKPFIFQEPGAALLHTASPPVQLQDAGLPERQNSKESNVKSHDPTHRKANPPLLGLCFWTAKYSSKRATTPLLPLVKLGHQTYNTNNAHEWDHPLPFPCHPYVSVAGQNSVGPSNQLPIAFAVQSSILVNHSMTVPPTQPTSSGGTMLNHANVAVLTLGLPHSCMQLQFLFGRCQATDCTYCHRKGPATGRSPRCSLPLKELPEPHTKWSGANMIGTTCLWLSHYPDTIGGLGKRTAQ